MCVTPPREESCHNMSLPPQLGSVCFLMWVLEIKLRPLHLQDRLGVNVTGGNHFIWFMQGSDN